MRRVLGLVEGQTERAFLEQLLAPLAQKVIAFTARIVGKPGHKGGIRSSNSILAEMVRAKCPHFDSWLLRLELLTTS